MLNKWINKEIKEEKNSIKSSPQQDKKKSRDFPGNPVVKTLSFNAGSSGLISAGGTKVPHASGYSQKCF